MDPSEGLGIGVSEETLRISIDTIFGGLEPPKG